jgi:hypothetical protein
MIRPKADDRQGDELLQLALIRRILLANRGNSLKMHWEAAKNFKHGRGRLNDSRPLRMIRKEASSQSEEVEE